MCEACKKNYFLSRNKTLSDALFNRIFVQQIPHKLQQEMRAIETNPKNQFFVKKKKKRKKYNLKFIVTVDGNYKKLKKNVNCFS